MGSCNVIEIRVLSPGATRTAPEKGSMVPSSLQTPDQSSATMAISCIGLVFAVRAGPVLFLVLNPCLVSSSFASEGDSVFWMRPASLGGRRTPRLTCLRSEATKVKFNRMLGIPLHLDNELFGQIGERLWWCNAIFLLRAVGRSVLLDFPNLDRISYTTPLKIPEKGLLIHSR